MYHHVSELPRFSGTRGEELGLDSGGKLTGATVGSLRYRQLGVRGSLFPRKTRFVDCHFADWRLGEAHLPGVSFERCTFENVRIGWVMGVESMTNCAVDGVFRALLSGRTRVTGNDFSKAIGVRFDGGVRLDRNKFADDGSQLIVTRTHPNWPRAVARAAEGDVIADSLVKNLSGKQAWTVFYLTETPSKDWDFYTEHFGGGLRAEANDEGTLPSFGHGQIGFTDAATDDEAWRRVQSERLEPLFDVQLTPSGLHLLGDVVGLPASRRCDLVREDDARMLLRLHPDFVQSLRAVTDQASLLQDWTERVESLEEGEWADDPEAVLSHLLSLVERPADGGLYAVLIN